MREKLPGSIKHPETFKKSLSAGFDGVFDWSWTDGCFGQTRITPMDFDGVIERKGNFLIFETKNEGTPIPNGQLYTLQALYAKGFATICFIYGKEKPEKIKTWRQPGFGSGQQMADFVPVENIEQARKFVSDWYVFANNNPPPPPQPTERDLTANMLTGDMDFTDWMGNVIKLRRYKKMQRRG